MPNSLLMLPLQPFLSATSIALPKPGGLLKSQMLLQNARRQGHTVLKKTAKTILFQGARHKPSKFGFILFYVVYTKFIQFIQNLVVLSGAPCTSRYTSTVISKAKAESWQKTYSSLFPKTCPSNSFLYSAPSLVPFPQLDLISPTSKTVIPHANQLFAHLQSHFSYLNPKTLLKY